MACSRVVGRLLLTWVVLAVLGACSLTFDANELQKNSGVPSGTGGVDSGIVGGSGGLSGGGGFPVAGAGGASGGTAGAGGTSGATGGSGGASGGSGGASGGSGGGGSTSGLKPCAVGSDDFNDGTIGSIWNAWGAGQHKEEAGVLKLSPDPIGSAHLGISTIATADLTNCAVSVELVQVLSSADSTDVYILFSPAPPVPADFVSIGWDQGKLHLRGASSAIDLNFDQVAHRWLRIAATQGTTVLETSPDGNSWTQQFAVPTPGSHKLGRVELAAGTWKSQPSVGSAFFDNFNH